MSVLFRTVLLAAALTARPHQASAASGPAAAPSQPKPEFNIQIGHTGAIHSVRMTPSGRFLLTAGQDQTIKLWDARTGAELRTFLKQQSEVTSLAPLPGDAGFAAGCGGTVKLWRLGEKQPYKSLSGEAAGGSIAVSRDGRRLAATGEFGRFFVWDLRSGQQFFRASVAYAARAVAFSPDGSLLAAAGGDEGLSDPGGPSDSHVVEVWNLSTNKLVRRFLGEAAYDSVAISPDSLLIAATYGTGGFRVWRLKTGEEVLAGEPRGSVLKGAVAFSPDSRLAAVGSDEGVLIWDLRTKELAQRIAVPSIRTLDFSPDGRFLAVGTWGSGAHLWEVATGNHELSFAGLARPVESLAVTSDGKKLAVAAGGLFVWDLAEGSARGFQGPQRAPKAVAAGDDPRYIVSGGYDSDASLWDIDSGQTVKTLTVESDAIFLAMGIDSIALSLDGRYLLAKRFSSAASLINMADGSKVGRFPPGNFAREGLVAVSPDGAFVATAFTELLFSREERGQIWEASTGKDLGMLVAPAPYHHQGLSALAFSPDGRLVAGGGFGGEILVWDFQSRKLLHTLSGLTTVRSIQFDRESKRLMAGGKIFDAATGRVLRTFPSQSESTTAASFIPGKPFIVTGGKDAMTRLWSSETGREVCRLINFPRGWVAITPDGYYDGSIEGLKQIRWTVGLESFPLDAFSEGFYTPGLVARILSGEPAKSPARPLLSSGFAPPPTVRIISPQNGTAATEDAIRVTVEAVDEGGGVDEIRLYHNGKAVESASRDIKAAPRNDKARMQAFDVQLLDGENVFEAVGFSRDRVEGGRARVAVSLAAPDKVATLHVLAVGINRYKNPSLDLNYAQPDALGLSSFFRERAGALFRRADIQELYDADATKAAIMSKLAGLEKSESQDVVIVYLAGHGDFIGDAWRFVPTEVLYPEREEELKDKAISSAELLTAIRRFGAKKVVVLMDACKSGGAVMAFGGRSFEERKALYQLGKAAGVHVVAASSADQIAAEVKELGHGIFTYAVLEALKGTADGSPKDGIVTVRELESYVESRLPELSKRYRSQGQLPTGYSLGNDFPLSRER